jgi:hypothetical protein
MRVANWLVAGCVVTAMGLVACSGSKANTKETPKETAPAAAEVDAGPAPVVDAGPPPPATCDLFAPACAEGQACYLAAVDPTCGPAGAAAEAAACTTSTECAPGLHCAAAVCSKPCDAAHACATGFNCTITDAAKGVGGCTAAPVEVKKEEPKPAVEDKKKGKKGKK